MPQAWQSILNVLEDVDGQDWWKDNKCMQFTVIVDSARQQQKQSTNPISWLTNTRQQWKQSTTTISRLASTRQQWKQSTIPISWLTSTRQQCEIVQNPNIMVGKYQVAVEIFHNRNAVRQQQALHFEHIINILIPCTSNN